MGLLIEGEWKDQWYDTKATGGRFKRQESAFRHWVTPDGEGGFRAEPGRYHLYVSLACPWAHRTLIFRKLKGLEEMIDVTVVDPLMLDQGWVFSAPEPLFGATKMHEIYTRARTDYTGRVTVPVLWDKKTGTIVSNESSEIIRMFNSAFDDLGALPGDYYPADLAAAIDEVNGFVYSSINNGVYKAGFATTQDAYEEAFDALFDALDELDKRLARNRYLVGHRITEADWRLFTTLVRFDPVYVGHFKCNRQRIADYAHLSGYLRELYQWKGVAETVDFDHIMRHYYASHKTINPTGVVPKGPALNLDAPHGRDGLARSPS
ncbi:MAG: glutathione S-transferase family protein [Magnetovibrionaceae bacterium]